MSGCGVPGACSSCGFPISDEGPAHAVMDGSGREVCDRCWHNPCLFFLPRQLEIHGTERAVKEALWRSQLGIPQGQTTFGSVVPDFAEHSFSAKQVRA